MELIAFYVGLAFFAIACLGAVGSLVAGWTRSLTLKPFCDALTSAFATLGIVMLLGIYFYEIVFGA